MSCQHSIDEIGKRCYDCLRPKIDCFCDAIPTIANQTSILIVQHARERSHAFNTARIVARALSSCQLVAGFPADLNATKLPIQPGSVLLYPDPAAKPISDLEGAARPSQLVILDGTWHHAKKLARRIDSIQRLQRYQLNPDEPGRYRIRREPNDQSLSTLEAVVAAMKILEPTTSGLDQLTNAFDRMVVRQLEHRARYGDGWRKRNRGRLNCPTRVNIPRVLGGDLANLVVAYGESAAGGRDNNRPRPPVYWVAERLGTGERFATMVHPHGGVSAEFLAHLELTEQHFSNAVSLASFREQWKRFLRPKDTLVVYNRGVTRMLRQLDAHFAPYLILKSIRFRKNQDYKGLDELVHAERLVIEPAVHPGRAGRRLANAIALTRHIHWLARRSMSAPKQAEAG